MKVSRLWIIALLIASTLVLAAPHGASAKAHGIERSIEAWSAQGAKDCATPPANFNPQTASAAQIAYYGLPPRPSRANELGEWEYVVRHARSRACEAIDDTRVPQTQFTIVDKDFYNWSGYVTKEAGRTYNAVRGWFQIRCSGVYDHAATWVGIGGTLGTGDSLWQAGWDAAAASSGTWVSAAR